MSEISNTIQVDSVTLSDQTAGTISVNLVNKYSHIQIAQTAGNSISPILINLPIPSNSTISHRLVISNTGLGYFAINNNLINPNTATEFIFIVASQTWSTLNRQYVETTPKLALVKLYSGIYSNATNTPENPSGYAFIVPITGRYRFDLFMSGYAAPAGYKTTDFMIRQGTTILANDTETTANNTVHVPYTGILEVDLVAGTTYNAYITFAGGIRDAGDQSRIYYKLISVPSSNQIVEAGNGISILNGVISTKSNFWQGQGATNLFQPTGCLEFPIIRTGSGTFVTVTANRYFTLPVGVYKFTYNTNWVQKTGTGVNNLFSVELREVLNTTTGALNNTATGRIGAMTSIGANGAADTGTGIITEYLTLSATKSFGINVINSLLMSINEVSNNRVISLIIEKIE
jgi:hypothetical protein